MIDDILEYNGKFVAAEGYIPFVTDKYPSKKLAVLTCMDCRLTELLPRALGLRNGDAKLIKNAGGLVLSQTDSAIRSLLVAVYELGVKEIMVVHHSSCGACHMSFGEFLPLMKARGISDGALGCMREAGVDLDRWLDGFHDTGASVRRTVANIVEHPLMPEDVTVRGFVIDSTTGRLTEVPDDSTARVMDMEERFERVLSARAKGTLSEVRADVAALDGYMASGLWKEDFERDEAGHFPSGLKRGVLSEDALYDLLMQAASE